MNVLVVNVGSSTVKLDVVDPDDNVLAAKEVEGAANHEEMKKFADRAPSYDAIGHRIVHGGARFTEPTVVDNSLLAVFDELCDLAPLHNPPAINVLRGTLGWDDQRPNVACFDTTFHSTLTEAARTYAVPDRWRTDLGIRRFGFHGLSHAYAATRAAELLGRDGEDLRLVNCHLGAGASLAAIENGRSIDTTMGFTPVEGLVMATRSGDFDPGALAWLLDKKQIRPDDVDDVLNHHSGLHALAGTSDMRVAIERREAGDPRATLAVAVYVHRLSKAIASMAAAMSGVDAISFTGGIGENAATIRALACEPLAFLGVELDGALNAASAETDLEVSAAGSSTRVVVIRAREEVEIARQVRAVLTS